MLRVLAVDDDPDTAASTALLLTVWGHEVRTARDGTAAVRAAAHFRPDVVFLDLGLPDMDGCEVARQIQRQAEKPPVIICLSGSGRDEDRCRSQQAGCEHHVLKPADPEELKRLLGQLQARPPTG
jgi:CheY-like chemotaxis protein